MQLHYYRDKIEEIWGEIKPLIKLTHPKIKECLTEKEKEIVRRGRNAENHHVAKNASVAEYSQATAFEALIGYLYLTKQDERLQEILTMCLD